MELDHEFAVAADAETAWQTLLDVERMSLLMPGVVCDSGSGDEYHGRIKLKFGPTTITYKGAVRIAVVDDLTRTAIFEATAREARGPGTATASFQATVHPAAEGSQVTLHTTVELTGRAATLTEHLVHDTGAKLLARFAAHLATELAPPTAPTEPAETAIAEPAEAEPAEGVAEEPVEGEPVMPIARPTAVRASSPGAREELDLYELMERPSVARRLLPVAGVLVLLFLLRRLLRGGGAR